MGLGIAMREEQRIPEAIRFLGPSPIHRTSWRRVRELAAGSFLASAPIIAVSSRTGEGLDQLRAALVEADAEAHKFVR